MDTIKYYCTDAWFEGTEIYYEKLKYLNQFKGKTYLDKDLPAYLDGAVPYYFLYWANFPHNYSD